MRHSFELMVLVALAAMLPPFSALAEKVVCRPGAETTIQGGKDRCLLAEPGNCDRVWTIQGKISAIEKEMKKGSAVYTGDELRILQKRLADAKREAAEDYYGGR